MFMDPGSREGVDFGDQFTIPNSVSNQESFVPNSSISTHMVNCTHQEPFPNFPSHGSVTSENTTANSNPFPMPALPTSTPSSISTTTELDNSEDSSEAVDDDAVLAYINHFLLEDEDEEACLGACTLAQHPALLAVEKPFVDILTASKPTAASEEISRINGSSNIKGGRGGLDDVSMNRQPHCQSTHELVKEKEECTLHKGRKNPHDDSELEAERRSKQSALCEEETVREMFDSVLLCTRETCEFQVPLPPEAEAYGTYVKGSGNRRGRKKGKSGAVVEDNTVDLTTLLIHCAQAAAIDDCHSANRLLKQIRQHSSAYGDASQRLAFCFSNGLEARLAGTGSNIYQSLVAKCTSTSDILKAFRLYDMACPFKKISYYFANKAILNASQGVARLHIIDYGINYGFQWPVFMQMLSRRPGGPPRLRITGIDFPQPGFRPAERIEATGRRLAEYAQMFNVPFEYHAITAKWDMINMEDLRIDRDEFLVVSCLFRLRYLMDETLMDDSPRVRVLNTIRKMSPNLFIHGILNGTYNTPFFVTRFKETLFHFSSLFDMLEVNASRVDKYRLLIEREIFGREVINAVACEGTERIERPETYKQWQIRNLRAGFRQLPLNEETVKRARYIVNKCYHRDFLVAEDNRWLLQGWKGRIIFALSTWIPN